MMEKLIKSKLTQKLKAFIQFQSTSLQQLSFTKVSIKPRLMQQFSQALSIPLNLINGSIDIIKINKAWDKFFSINRDDPLVIQIKGLKIKATLSNQLQRSYVHLKKKNIIKKFTETLQDKINNDSTYTNKLKQYFLDAIVIELTDAQLEIQMNLKHSIVLNLSLEAIRFDKDTKNHRHQFSLDKLSINYRLKNDSKKEYIINQAYAHFVNNKTSKQSLTKLTMKSLAITINNQNFNDIRRLLELIKWHNSFVNLPEYLWNTKPKIIGTINAKTKLKYICEMIKYKIIQKKYFSKILVARRHYLTLYRQVNKQPTNMNLAFQLEILQQKMQLWQIKAYRKFYHDLQKSNISTITIQNPNIAQKQNKTSENWFFSWFKTKQEHKILNQLKDKLQQINIQKIKSVFTANIQQIRIRLNIKSHCNEPFLNLISLNNIYQVQKIPIQGSPQKQLNYQKQQKFSIQRFMINFDKYNGHCDQCRYFVHQDSIKKISDQSEFEDIENFLQMQKKQNKVSLFMQPITVIFNEEIKQKIQIFKIQRIHNTFESSENLILIPKPQDVQKQQNDTIFYFQCSIQFLIPQTMYQSKSEFLTLYLTDLQYKADKSRKNIHIKRIQLASLLYVQKDLQYSVSQSITSQKQYQYQLIDLFRTKVNCQIQLHESYDNIRINVSPIKLKIQKIDHLCKLIKFISRFKPKKKENRPIYKLKNMRRKQSIGQQFIDACQNLNQHIVRSVISSDITKKQKYVKKDKKDINITVKLQKLLIQLEQEQLQTTSIVANIYLFAESQAIILEDQKECKFTIKSIKKFAENLKDIGQQISRVFQSPNTHIQRKFIQPETDGSQVKIYNLQANILIYQKNMPKLAINLSNIQLQKKKSFSKYLKFGANIAYYPSQMYIDRKICSKEEIGIENFNIYYHQQKGYNKHQKVIKIDELKINIKPILLQQISGFIQRLHIPDKKVYYISNHLINSINVSINGITYFQLKYLNEAASLSPGCDIIYFSRKQTLNLSENSNTQIFHATQNLKLIKNCEQRFHFILRSNFRITNRHDRLLCLRIIKLDDQVNKISQKNGNNEQFKYRKLNSLKQNRSSKSLHTDSDEQLEKKSKIERYGAQKLNQSSYLQAKQTEIIKTIIKPKHEIDILVESQQFFIELSDINSSGAQYEVFQRFKIGDILSDQLQKNLKSIWTSQEIEHNLIIKTKQIIEQQTQIKIFELDILSPVIIYNYMPWQLKYRYSKQQIDVMETIKIAGRQLRKRSFQAVPMEHVNPFTSSQNRNIKYQQITQIEIIIKDFMKIFRLDQIIDRLQNQAQKNQMQEDQSVGQNQKNYKTLLCLNDGKRNMQIILQICYTENILQIKLYPQTIFINMTLLNIDFIVQEQNYSYPLLKLDPLKQNTYYKDYLKINESQLISEDILKHLLLDYHENINIFTGSLDPEIQQYSIFGNNSPKQPEILFNKSMNSTSLNSHRQNIIQYSEKHLKIIIKKIYLDMYSPIKMIIFMPSLLIINKTQWNFFVKGQGQSLKKLPKQQIEYVIICSKVAIQACEQQQQISYGEWLKISLDTLGTFYYAKQMNTSNGYESRQYQLRKKRLKKVPKIFYRIVMTKYEFGYQMLIEESQYPPVTFINRCKSRIKVTEIQQQSTQQMQNNEMAEYAPKLPLYEPTFSLSMVQNYEFLFLGQFNLNSIEKRFKDKIRLNIQQYKDKKIVIFQDSTQKYLSQIRNQLLLQKIQKLSIIVDDLCVSVLNSNNRQLSCTCIKDIDLSHQTKSTKKYIKLHISNIEVYSYHTIQPTYLFHCKQKQQMFKIFKKKNYLDNTQILNLELVLDYHKHANILQKCRIDMLPITIIINANIIIDYIKYYYESVILFKNSLKHLQKGKKQKSKNSKQKNITSPWLIKNFVIQSFRWEGIKITIKPQNLQNFTLFVDQKSISYLIKWINWLGQLKPLYFQPLLVQYQQYNLNKLLKLIDVKAIMTKFTQVLLHYPLQQIYNVFSLIATLIGVNQSHENKQQFKTIKKITKSALKLFYIVLASGDSSSLPNKKQYRRLFQTRFKHQKLDFIQKIKEFKYAQWKASEEVNPTKLLVKVARFQRYTRPNQLLVYDKIYSRIKLATDSYQKNKIFREIKYAQLINHQSLIGVTEEWFVVYFMDRDEWIVVKPQDVLSFQVKKLKKKDKFINSFKVWIMYSPNEKSVSHAQQLIFKDILVERSKLQEIWEYIYSLKLSSIY